MKALLRFFFFFALLSPTIVHAVVRGDGSEELTYDDLVNELAAKQHRLRAKSAASPFDDVRVHADFGLMNSFSTFAIGGKNVTRYQNGLQLSAGVDLFSPNWFAETAWRNFGLTVNGPEEHNLRELDMKFGYRDRLNSTWSYRLQAGLADRTLRISDPTNGIAIDDTTPCALGAGGIVLEMGPHASLNFDGSVRAPMIGRTADKGSWDFAIDLKVSL